MYPVAFECDSCSFTPAASVTTSAPSACPRSFSRSAVVVSTGGSSQLAGIVTAASVVLTLKLFTPYFTHVPKAVLASCLIVAVSGLIDLKLPGKLWKDNKFTFGLYVLYMSLMLTLGAAEGLMASVVVYYIARLAGAPLSDTGRPLKRPLIFEKLIAKTPAALQENTAS